MLAGIKQAAADIDPLTGIDFVTITHAGNAPWAGNGTPDDQAIRRGSVGYEYRIGRFEVTTEQWVRFFNAALDRPANDRIPHLTPPTFWGAVPTTPNVSGGQRWRVPPGNEMRAVGNISWRTAAIFANWLCNDLRTDREAFLTGAYDVSTFGYIGNQFTDQQVRSPGARYFIPTWDEWLKAVHFSPDRFGQGQPGWWVGPAGRPGLLPGGPPGVGDANWTDFPGWQNVPLGAYAHVESPWGLLDYAGATSEWTEDVIQFSSIGARYRRLDGSHWGSNSSGIQDVVYVSAGDFPSIPTFDFGFRIAAVVPTPGSCIPVAVAILLHARSRSRRSIT